MKIVIVGGGFAGLKFARMLNNRPGVEVLLIDRFNHHQFQPLFYQVATAGLDASNISFPLRKAFQGSRNVRIRVTEVKAVHTEEKRIDTGIGQFPYDLLVIATGADTNFFGNVNLQTYTYPMKSTSEALQLRHTLVRLFEEALITDDEKERQRLMTLVIVGGGPTGVELSGALAEMKRYILPRDYPELDFSRMRICLLEGSDRTLGTMSEQSSRDSKAYLQKLGVEVKTNTLVKDYDGTSVWLQDGTFIESKTVIWAAGVQGNVPEGLPADSITRGRRVVVDRFNRVKGLDNIYALGDVAYMETPLYPKGHPQVANVAINQAKNLAQNIQRQLKGKTWKEFEYKDKGSMATVGRHLAVVDIPKPRLHLGGLLAWIIWMALHLVLILGVKNRLQVLVNWAYKYLTYDQNLRLVFQDFNRERPTATASSITSGSRHRESAIHRNVP